MQKPYTFNFPKDLQEEFWAAMYAPYLGEAVQAIDRFYDKLLAVFRKEEGILRFSEARGYRDANYGHLPVDERIYQVTVMLRSSEIAMLCTDNKTQDDAARAIGNFVLRNFPGPSRW
jgi:hypothetical protein